MTQQKRSNCAETVSSSWSASQLSGKAWASKKTSRMHFKKDENSLSQRLELCEKTSPRCFFFVTTLTGFVQILWQTSTHPWLYPQLSVLIVVVVYLHVIYPEPWEEMVSEQKTKESFFLHLRQWNRNPYGPTLTSQNVTVFNLEKSSNVCLKSFLMNIQPSYGCALVSKCVIPSHSRKNVQLPTTRGFIAIENNRAQLKSLQRFLYR